MTGEERKALSFVALLLGLSVVARAMNRPDALAVTGAGTVNIQARLEQNQQARQRLSKPARTSKATPPPPQPVSTPRWRRGQLPPVTIDNRESGGSQKPLNVNRATVAELDALPGVSPAVAARIVEYRTARGRFTTIEELDSVKGIGPALLAKLKPLVVFR